MGALYVMNLSISYEAIYTGSRGYATRPVGVEI
jgi:hypothetical protein